MAHCFYVYYKIEPESELATAAAVDQLFLALQDKERVRGRLLKRADDAATWMEVYENVMDAGQFRTTLDAAAKKCGLSALTKDGQRHVEHFWESGEAVPTASPDA
jgi:hypothetical protein